MYITHSVSCKHLLCQLCKLCHLCTLRTRSVVNILFTHMLKMGLDRQARLLLCAHCVFQSLFKASYLLFRAACRDKACLEFSNVLLEQSFEEFVQRSLRASPLTNQRPLGDSCWSVCTEMLQYKAQHVYAHRGILSFSNRSSFVEGVKGVFAWYGIKCF